MYKITQNFKANQLRKENNELQQGIEQKLDAINDSIQELISVMRGEK